MKESHLWPEPVRVEGKWITVSATLESPAVGRRLLWYRLPAEQGDSLTTGCEPFVVGTLFRVMCDRRTFRVHGRVASALLRNLEEYQTVWEVWRPQDYSRVEIVADEEMQTVPAVRNGGALVAFSGGVDSAFTAYRHVRGIGTRFPRDVRAAVMVQGLDIPLEEPETFENARARSLRMTDSLGLMLIPMATNFRELTPKWKHSFGTALASSMMVLSGGYSEGLISLGTSYANYHRLPEGTPASNALTDALLSYQGFTIVPDAAGFERIEKVHFLSKWPEFLENMRVCWSGPQKDRNCCVCEKCINTILTFRALGRPLPASFPQDVSNRQIRELGPLWDFTMEAQYSSMVSHAMKMHAKDSWVKELRASLRRNRRRNRWNETRAARIWASLKRVPYYAVRPSTLVFRLKHGHLPEEKS